jgi:hypothetical protein
MSDLDLFSNLPATAQLAVVCISLCVSALGTLLIFAPRRNCWFFRRSPEARFFALLFAPALLILWPIMLFGVILKSRGISPDDPEFLDD